MLRPIETKTLMISSLSLWIPFWKTKQEQKQRDQPKRPCAHTVREAEWDGVLPSVYTGTDFGPWAGESHANCLFPGSVPSESSSFLTFYSSCRDLAFEQSNLAFFFLPLRAPSLSQDCLALCPQQPREPALTAKVPSPRPQLLARVKMPERGQSVQGCGWRNGWRDFPFSGAFNVGILQICIKTDKGCFLRRWNKAFPVLGKFKNKSWFR